jgi:hypothetical protein
MVLMSSKTRFENHQKEPILDPKSISLTKSEGSEMTTIWFQSQPQILKALSVFIFTNPKKLSLATILLQRSTLPNLTKILRLEFFQITSWHKIIGMDHRKSRSARKSRSLPTLTKSKSRSISLSHP